MLLGFHGCEREEQIELLDKPDYFRKSNNKYDKKHPSETGDDKILRYLDCAVIEYLHYFNSISDLQPYDSVKTAFLEGNPLYPGAGFREKTHVQICVRNPNCIKGFFIPRIKDSGYSPV